MMHKGEKDMLNQKDINRLWNLNKKNGWGFSSQQILTMATKHMKARQIGNLKAMEEIEYRLEDANFHTECNMLRCGQYNELKSMIKARR